jgi:hypothetical protein
VCVLWIGGAWAADPADLVLRQARIWTGETSAETKRAGRSRANASWLSARPHWHGNWLVRTHA